MQLDEVPRLQEHVAELGERQALLPLLQAGPDRVLANHLVDAEQLPYVAQEIEEAGFGQPVGVVGQDGRLGGGRPDGSRVGGGAGRGAGCLVVGLSVAAAAAAVVQVEKSGDLGPDRGPVGVELLGVEQVSFFALAARVADHPGAAPDQGDGPVAGQLEPSQQAQLLQMPDVKAVGRGVESDVEHQPARVDAVGQDFLIGDLVDQTPPAEILEQRRHHLRLPRKRGRA